jgi:hypothetical protein
MKIIYEEKVGLQLHKWQQQHLIYLVESKSSRRVFLRRQISIVVTKLDQASILTDTFISV